MTPLTEKIAEVIESSLTNPEGIAAWRGKILDEEWKILVTYTGRNRESFQIVIKRRDQI